MSAQRNAAVNEHKLNIRSGIPVLSSKYGLTVDEYDYLDMAVDLLRDISTYGTTEYIAFLEIDKVGNALLPCNIDCIDALVTRKMGIKNFSTRVEYDTHTLVGTDAYYTATAIMESARPHPNPIVNRHSGTAHPLAALDNDNLGHGQTLESPAYKTPNAPRFIDPTEQDGYISYHLVDRKTISVDAKFAGSILALAYTGISVDAEGFPLITRKQSNALAIMIAKYVLFKRSLKGDQGAANSLAFVTAEAGRLIQAASIPENITDNEIDGLLDAKTSFNRKRVNRPSRYRR